MSLNDRLRIVVNEFFHGNKAAFARAAKISDQRAYSFLSVRSNTEPPARVLENLAKYLPNLNATWLLTGEGEMIQDKSTPEMPITLVSVNEYKSRLQQMEVRLEALRAQVVLKDNPQLAESSEMQAQIKQVNDCPKYLSKRSKKKDKTAGNGKIP